MKTLLKIGIPLLVLGIGFGLYMWNKPHQNVFKAKPAHTLAAKTLSDAFQNDETAAGVKYAGQIVEVSGKVSELIPGDEGTMEIVLDVGNPLAGVSCVMEDPLEKVLEYGIKAGDRVKLKGFVQGSLMDMVVMERCVLVE